MVRLFERRLAPFLSQKAVDFWSPRLWYFEQGLYYQVRQGAGGGPLAWPAWFGWLGGRQAYR